MRQVTPPTPAFASEDNRGRAAGRLVQRVGGSRLALIVAASVIASMMGATIAGATIPDATNVIHACYADGMGQLRVIDSATSGCKNNETPLAWARAGLAGYQIVTGDTKPVPANNAAFVVAHAACSPGKKLLGGGFHTNNVEVVQNFPQTSGAIAPRTHARGSRAAHHRHAAAVRALPM